jgi:hypothetical protein
MSKNLLGHWCKCIDGELPRHGTGTCIYWIVPIAHYRCHQKAQSQWLAFLVVNSIHVPILFTCTSQVCFKIAQLFICLNNPNAYSGVDNTNHFWHLLSSSPIVIVWKMMGPHLILYIILNGFTVGTWSKVWCDWGMSLHSVCYISLHSIHYNKPCPFQPWHQRLTVLNNLLNDCDAYPIHFVWRGQHMSHC